MEGVHAEKAGAITQLKSDDCMVNHHIPQKNIGYRTPIQTLKEWQKKQPDLLVSEAALARTDVRKPVVKTTDLSRLLFSRRFSPPIFNPPALAGGC